jgi:predicted DNA binding protein
VKHVRVTVRPDPDRAPPFVTFLLASPDVTEARAVDWNRADAATTTHLDAIDGDAAEFAARARETPGVDSVTLAATDAPTSYALLDVRDTDVPMFGTVEEALARVGLVVRRPLVYHDERTHGHVVGDPAALQAVLDEVPSAVDVRIDEIGPVSSVRATPLSTLSERQRAALEAAAELGYYDHPRATHADVAETLDCAPPTASEHLQKAEAKLVHAVLDRTGVWSGEG